MGEEHTIQPNFLILINECSCHYPCSVVFSPASSSLKPAPSPHIYGLYSYSLLGTRTSITAGVSDTRSWLGISPLLHTHDRLSPVALFQFLRPITKTRRGCDIALLPVIAASNAPNAALPSITQRISFHFCCSTHAISSRVPCTMKKMHGPYNNSDSQQLQNTCCLFDGSNGRESIYWVSGCS